MAMVFPVGPLSLGMGERWQLPSPCLPPSRWDLLPLAGCEVSLASTPKRHEAELQKLWLLLAQAGAGSLLGGSVQAPICPSPLPEPLLSTRLFPILPAPLRAPASTAHMQGPG